MKIEAGTIAWHNGGELAKVGVENRTQAIDFLAAQHAHKEEPQTAPECPYASIRLVV